MFIQNISCPQPGKVYYTLEKCSQDELAQIEAYRVKFLGVMLKYMLASDKNSLWAISCSGHGYGASGTHYGSSKERVPEEKGLSAKDAVERFVFNGTRI